MGSHGRVVCSFSPPASPSSSSLLEQAGYSVDARSRPLESADVEADVAVVFRGRLLGREPRRRFSESRHPGDRGADLRSAERFRADWVRLSNRVPKPDLVQVVHAVAAWAGGRVGAALPAA